MRTFWYNVLQGKSLWDDPVSQWVERKAHQLHRRLFVDVKFVVARPGHAKLFSQIAWAAKRHWGYPAEWLERWRETLTVRPEQIRTGKFIAAVRGRHPIGFAGLRRDATECWLQHLWVLPSFAGRGIGRQLFAQAVEQAKAAGASTMLIEADPNAEGFYLRMGAIRYGTKETTVAGVPRRLPLLRYSLG